MTRKNLIRRVLYGVSIILAVSGIYRFTRPILFHWPGKCVCTDFSGEVDGFTVFNPLRNLASERAADRFLESVRDGNVVVSTYVEPQLAEEYISSRNSPIHHLKWKLKYRENKGDLVFLFYKFDQTGAMALSDWGSEGKITMKDYGGYWKANRFDVVW